MATNNNMKSIDKLFDDFKQQAEALSASVYRVDGISGAARRVEEIIREKGTEKTVAARSNLVDKCLEEVDTENNLIYTEELQKHAKDAGVGISEINMAVSETGSLVQDASELDQRLVSTLPSVHVVLVPTGALVEKFNDAIGFLNRNKDNIPDYISFISGPSRTADIERVLTIGVHGPEEVHIIITGSEDGGEAVE